MKTIKLSDLKLNDGSHGLPKNPRFIKDKRFEALCRSVKENPEFMPPRPIVVDEAGVILGGNMRYRACRELGMTEIPADWVRVVEGLSVEKKRRFIILDNRGFGDDDFDMLANEWDIDELIGAGFSEEELGNLAGDIEPYGNTSTDREGQGVTSTWESCKKSGSAPVIIGAMESRITFETAKRLADYCEQKYEAEQKPINETLEQVILCGLQS